MVEIIPKQAPEQFFSRTTFLYAGIGLFVAAASAFFIIQQLQVRAAEELQRLEIVLTSGKTQEERLLEGRMTSLQRKVKDFANLIEGRQDSLQAFLFLEKHTHPQLTFSKADFHSQTHLLTLQGRAQDFTTVEAQVALFLGQEEVSSVNVSRLELGEEGEVLFTLEVAFSPSLFQ